MIIYVDTNHRCHADNAEGRTPYDLQFFDGKASGAIECYEYYPAMEDTAERIKAVEPASIIDAFQKQHDADMVQVSDMQTALEILGVTE